MSAEPPSQTTEPSLERSTSSQPPTQTPPADEPPTKKRKTTESNPKAAPRRFTKLYDAVAGRGGPAGPVIKQNFFSEYIATRPTASADEILFRSNSAPDRFEENDIYFRKRPSDMSVLPNSELLKSLHAYTSFYVDGQLKDKDEGDKALVFEKFDGAALLALGVLVEEMAREVVQKENVVERLFDEGDGEKGRDRSALDLMEEVKRWQGRKGRGRGDLETWRVGTREMEEMEAENGDGSDDEPDAEVDDEDLDLEI